MQSYELLREVFRRTSPKQVAAEPGLSLSLISESAEPLQPQAGSGAANPWDPIEALQSDMGRKRFDARALPASKVKRPETGVTSALVSGLPRAQGWVQMARASWAFYGPC